MATATKAPYSPTITEAQPHSNTQRDLADQGHRGFWVQSNSDPSKKYLVHLFPDGALRCSCKASEYGHNCCHKQALQLHLASEQVLTDHRTEEEQRAGAAQALEQAAAHRARMSQPAPQMTFACPRPAAKPDRRETAMPAYAGESRFDPLTGLLRTA